MRKKDIVTVLMLLLASLVVRLLYLGRCDLWGDEVLLITSALLGSSPSDVISNYWHNYVVAYGWLPVPAVVSNVGYHIIGKMAENIQANNLLIRLPLTLIASFCPLCVYWLGRQLFNRQVAIAASLVTVFFYYPVYYSRELHAYPILMTFCPLFLALYFRVLTNERKRALFVGLLFLCGALLGYAHYTCTFFLAGIGFFNTLLLLYYFFKKRNDAVMLKALCLAEGALVLVGVLVLPLFYRLITEQSPHLAMSQGLSFFVIANDGVVKMLFGNHLLPTVLAWGLVLLGGASIIRQRKPMQIMFLCIYAMGVFAITVAALRTQYVSSRYYSSLYSMLYLIICAGLFELIALFTKENKRMQSTAFFGVLTIALGYHMIFVLPYYYKARDKFLPYGQVARWMNVHIPAGNPFMFECGSWEFRYIPAWFRTPNLIPAARIPIMDQTKSALREVQTYVMNKFPLSAYIERTELVEWEYPRKHYQKNITLYDKSVCHLEAAGLSMQFRKNNDFIGSLTIRYNDRDDAIDLAKKAGQVLYFDYTGWGCVALEQERYIWGTQQNNEIRIVNVLGKPVQVELKIFAFLSSSGAPVALKLSYDGKDIGTTHLQNHQLSSIRVPKITVAASGGVVRLQGAYNGWLLVPDIQVTELKSQ